MDKAQWPCTRHTGLSLHLKLQLHQHILYLSRISLLHTLAFGAVSIVRNKSMVSSA